MPVGIVETALVIAAVKGASSQIKKRKRRSNRRNFFVEQRQQPLLLGAGDNMNEAELSISSNTGT